MLRDSYREIFWRFPLANTRTFATLPFHTQRESTVLEFIKYRRTQIAEMTPWVQGFDMSRVSVSLPDGKPGFPKPGDMIARNPKNHADRWLVAAQYFVDNFEPV